MSNYTHQPDSKALSFSIIALKAVFKKHLIGKDKPYESLLREFLKYDYYDDDIGLPDTGKAVYSKVNINSGTYRKWLVQIHSDLMDLIQEEQAPALSYSKYHCLLVIRGQLKTSATIPMMLSHVPKIGEDICLPFLKATLLSESFYVNKITHRFSDRKHQIVLFLESGYFNAYLKMEDEKEYIVNRYEWIKKEHAKF